MMKKIYIYSYILLTITIFGCSNCQKNKAIENIVEIELYYISFGSLFHNDGFNKKTIKETKKNLITDKSTIDNILNLIHNLEELDNSSLFQHNNIYIAAELMDRKGIKKSLLCDKKNFKLGDCYYKKNKILIDLLIDSGMSK